MNRAQVVALLVGKGVLGASLVVGFGSSVASASPSGESVHIRQSAVQVSEIDVESDGSVFVTDQAGVEQHKLLDNGTWRGVTESDEQWSCVDDGNHVCGPTNDEGKPAGCYGDGGVLVAVWPCSAWRPQAAGAQSAAAPPQAQPVA